MLLRYDEVDVEQLQDYVGALNIGSRFLPLATTRRATVGLAQVGDELGAEPSEPRNRKEAQLTQPRQSL